MTRRTLLKLIAASGAVLAPAAALAKPRPIDKRLLGTWRSDKERTTKLWRYKNDLTPEKKEKFESIFGKMTKRFTESHAYSEFEGEKTSGPYRVLASDKNSVVVAYPDGNGQTLQQIFFEDG